MEPSAARSLAAGARAAFYVVLLTFASVHSVHAAAARVGRLAADAEAAQLAPGPRSSFDWLGTEMGQGDGVAPLAEDGTLDVNDKAEQQILEGDYTVITSDVCNGVAGLCDLPLERVSFAGAHVSASYGPTIGCNDRVPQYLCPLMKPLSKCFMQAQEMDVHELLDTGARYLHTDVCMDDNGFVYACTGLDNDYMGLGPPLSSFLAAVKSFLDGNPRDVVVLHVEGAYGPPSSLSKLKQVAVEQVATTFGLESGSLLFRKQNVMASGGANIPVSILGEEGPQERNVHQHWPTLGAMVRANQRLVLVVSPSVYEDVSGRKGDFVLNLGDYFSRTRVVENDALQLGPAQAAMEAGCSDIQSSGKLGLLNAYIRFDFRKLLLSAAGSVVEDPSDPNLCLSSFSRQLLHTALPRVFNDCYDRLPGALITSVDLFGASFAYHYTNKRNELAVDQWADEIKLHGLADRLPWAPVRAATGEDTVLEAIAANGGPETYTLADKQNCMGCLYIMDSVTQAAKDSQDKTTDALGMIFEDACTNLATDMFRSACDELYSDEMIVIKLLQLELSSDKICRQRGLCEDAHFQDGFAPQNRALRGILGGPMPVLGAVPADPSAHLRALDQGDMSGDEANR